MTTIHGNAGSTKTGSGDDVRSREKDLAGAAVKNIERALGRVREVEQKGGTADHVSGTIDKARVDLAAAWDQTGKIKTLRVDHERQRGN